MTVLVIIVWMYWFYKNTFLTSQKITRKSSLKSNRIETVTHKVVFMKVVRMLLSITEEEKMVNCSTEKQNIRQK